MAKQRRTQDKPDILGMDRNRFFIFLTIIFLIALLLSPFFFRMFYMDKTFNEWKISREIRSEFSQVQRAQVRCVPGPAHFETILTVKRTDDETLMELAKQAIPFCQDILEEMYPASWPPTSKYDTYSLLIFFDLDDDRRADRFFVYDFRSNIIRQEENKPSDSYFHETKRPFACGGRDPAAFSGSRPGLTGYRPIHKLLKKERIRLPGKASGCALNLFSGNPVYKNPFSLFFLLNLSDCLIDTLSDF